MACSWILCRNDSVAVLCDTGDDRLTLVKAQRHRWQEARPANWSLLLVVVDVLLWAVNNILGPGNQVRGFITSNDPCSDGKYSRCLNGALNGNIGILKSLVSEITDSTNLPLAYGYMPIAWVCAPSSFDADLFSEAILSYIVRWWYPWVCTRFNLNSHASMLTRLNILVL
jgi:hypothetical protein